MNGYRLVPVWLPIAVTAVTIIATAGATYGIYGYRMSSAERRLDAIESDRQRRIDDYEKFKADIRVDIADIKGDLRAIRAAVEHKP